MSDQQQLVLGLISPSNTAHAFEVLHRKDAESSPWPLPPELKKVLGIVIYCRGAAAAIQIREISARTGLSDRAVKDAVRSLIVDFKVRIAGSRQEPYGYYLVTTAEEAMAAAAPLIHEIRELRARAEVLTDERWLREQLGQTTIESSAVSPQPSGKATA